MALFRGLAASTPLVLKEFSVDEGGQGDLVRITGRNPGLLAWIAGVLGLSGDTTLRVTNDQVYFSKTGKSSQVHQMVPLVNISSTHCNYSSPFWLLALAFVFAGTSFFSLVSATIMSAAGLGAGGFLMMVIFAVLAAGTFWIYTLSKSIHVLFETQGGSFFGLGFKPSVIEGVKVDIDGAMRAIGVINRRIMVLNGGADSLRPASNVLVVPSREV